MSGNHDHGSETGVVISDLHLFSGRSEGVARVESLRAVMSAANLIVLNGDIFDFRWSILRDPAKTLAAALEWLGNLADDFPDAQIHFIVGNHDCCRTFTRELARLAATLPRFHWHEYFLRLGSALFLHGDCAHRWLDHRKLDQFRELWRGNWQRGAFLTLAYRCADRLGITQRVHERHFPRGETVERIAFYLDDACPGWRQTTSDCYFGHTHLPFSNYEHDGVRFHNTGSAIRNMDFHPIVFETQLAPDRAPAQARNR